MTLQAELVELRRVIFTLSPTEQDRAELRIREIKKELGFILADTDFADIAAGSIGLPRAWNSGLYRRVHGATVQIP